MQTLTKQVLEHATGLPDGTPLVAKELLHLGRRRVLRSFAGACISLKGFRLNVLAAGVNPLLIAHEHH